ncbi:MAG: acetyltransferase [Lachnospiraceae bacterium]|jgi:sugar O-acyltransferase (sialic acid O-acetyltransferase NeuD family)|nr:acetyltransferase [Lachnospiraceae bacterium]
MILGIYGSGGSGCEVREIAEQQNIWEKIVFIDDMVEVGVFKGIERMPFKSFVQIYDKDTAEIVIALGEPEHKIALCHKVKEKEYPLAKVLHPMAWISPSANLEEGLIVHAQSFISSDTLIEENTCIEPGTIVGHDCIIRRNCQIAPNATLGGHCEVGEGTYIGMNVSVKEGIKIGKNSIIGMGSTVLRDIPENVIALGNPARVMKYKNGTKVFR